MFGNAERQGNAKNSASHPIAAGGLVAANFSPFLGFRVTEAVWGTEISVSNLSSLFIQGIRECLQENLGRCKATQLGRKLV